MWYFCSFPAQCASLHLTHHQILSSFFRLLLLGKLLRMVHEWRRKLASCIHNFEPPNVDRGNGIISVYIEGFHSLFHSVLTYCFVDLENSQTPSDLGH